MSSTVSEMSSAVDKKAELERQLLAFLQKQKEQKQAMDKEKEPEQEQVKEPEQKTKSEQKAKFEQELFRHPKYLSRVVPPLKDDEQYKLSLFKHPYYFRHSAKYAAYGAYTFCEPYLYQFLDDDGVYKWAHGERSQPFIITSEGFDTNCDGVRAPDDKVYTSLDQLSSETVKISWEALLVDVAKRKPRYFATSQQLAERGKTVEEYQQECESIENAKSCSSDGVTLTFQHKQDFTQSTELKEIDEKKKKEERRRNQ